MKKLTLFIALLCLPFAVFAAQFEAGKDYQVIKLSNTDDGTAKFAKSYMRKPGKVTVTEFFNYGCPACYHFEPVLEIWLTAQAKKIYFQRIPVVFSPEWQILAKAYYTAEKLDVTDKMTPLIFKAIQKQGYSIENETDLEKLFVDNGIKQQEFRNAYEFSPEMGARLMHGAALMRFYQVYEIPTVIINGKYKTNPSMVKGDMNKFIKVLNFLVKESQTSQKKTTA